MSEREKALNVEPEKLQRQLQEQRRFKERGWTWTGELWQRAARLNAREADIMKRELELAKRENESSKLEAS